MICMKWYAFWMVKSFELVKCIWKGGMQCLFGYIDIGTGWSKGSLPLHQNSWKYFGDSLMRLSNDLDMLLHFVIILWYLVEFSNWLWSRFLLRNSSDPSYSGGAVFITWLVWLIRLLYTHETNQMSLLCDMFIVIRFCRYLICAEFICLMNYFNYLTCIYIFLIILLKLLYTYLSSILIFQKILDNWALSMTGLLICEWN
jgi:hypothetical protein